MLKNKRHMSISCRITLLFVAFFLVMTMLLIWGFCYSVKEKCSGLVIKNIESAATISALLIDGDVHARISGENRPTVEYGRIRRRLLEVRKHVDGAIAVYTLRRDMSGRFVKVVDSDTASADWDSGKVSIEVAGFLDRNYDSIDRVSVHPAGTNNLVSAFVPILKPDGRRDAILVIEADISDIDAFRRNLLLRVLIAVLLAVPFALAAGRIMGNRSMAAINSFKKEALAIAGGHLERKIDEKSHGELNELAVAINIMTGYLQRTISVLQEEILEHKRAEEILQESEERFRALAENTSDGIIQFDHELRYLYVNKTVEKYMGIPANEFTGRTHAELNLSPPEDVEKCENILLSVLRTGKSERIEYMMPDGEWLDFLVVPEIIRDNEVKRIICSVRGITGIKKSEEELRNTRNYLKNIMNSLSTMIISVNTEGQVMEWNRSAENYTGINEKDARNRYVWELLPFLKQYDDLLIQGSSIDENRIYHEGFGEGDPGHMSFSFHPLVSEGYRGTVIVIDDITEEERKDRLLLQAQKMESIGNLAGGIAHDFNNILSGILGTVSLMKYSRQRAHLPGRR